MKEGRAVEREGDSTLEWTRIPTRSWQREQQETAVQQQPLEPVPEGEEKAEASGSGDAPAEGDVGRKDEDENKDGDPDKMDTA